MTGLIMLMLTLLFLASFAKPQPAKVSSIGTHNSRGQSHPIMMMNPVFPVTIDPNYVKAMQVDQQYATRSPTKSPVYQHDRDTKNAYQDWVANNKALDDLAKRLDEARERERDAARREKDPNNKVVKFPKIDVSRVEVLMA